PEPLAVGYHGLRVFGQPPVSQGHILLEELAIAEGLDLGSQEWGSAELVHLMGETKKLAFADRDAHAGDPARVDFDAQRLLDPRSPNAVAPGKRPVHTLNTVIVLDGSMPRFVFGTPGRHAQVQTNFQLAVGLIDFGMDVQRAIEEPRWYHDSGRTLKMERRYP